MNQHMPMISGVSAEALELTRDIGVVDLHIDTFIPPRLWGYDPLRAHGPGLLRGHFFGHLDLPRMAMGGLRGAMWSITTNPLRTAKGRWSAFLLNLKRLNLLAEDSGGALCIVSNLTDYLEAESQGRHICLPAVQGGNALEAAPELASSIPGHCITRVTLVHLTNSGFGVTSSPLSLWRTGRGLTRAGHAMVESLNDNKILVDLAHINPAGFWDAVQTHDASQPLIATHTGVDGVRPHWRNLDDKQLKAIAETGGTIGVIFAAPFLRRRGGPRDVDMVLEHLSHIIDVCGEDYASIGSDYDGAIVPPSDCRDGVAYPRLTQRMLERGWSSCRIEKVLRGNALRVLGAVRP